MIQNKWRVRIFPPDYEWVLNFDFDTIGQADNCLTHLVDEQVNQGGRIVFSRANQKVLRLSNARTICLKLESVEVSTNGL